LNPALLVWARERAGLSVADVAAALGKSADVVSAWESGQGAPTYVQLEKLAYSIFKRPLALFFFPEPPEEPDPERSFRTLPAVELRELSADTRFKIRDARAMQIALKELNGGVNPSERKLWREIQLDPGGDVVDAVARVRAHLGIGIEEQQAWRPAADALAQWRRLVEEAGIFVFKNSFKQKDVSGFCLYDAEFPVIYINNGTAFTRQIFTLFHELAHLLLGTNGVTKNNDAYIGALSGDDRKIEVYCNRFAAEFLIPSREFNARVGDLPVTDELVTRVASEFKVSREVVLRRFLDLGRITREHYQARAAEWKADFERGRGAVAGGNYYATQASYLGNRYLDLVFSRYHQGAISTQQTAEYLQVRESSIPGLEQFVLGAAR
jgi:Zn-dependent peptidase ImmA (M78 family)